MLEIISRSLMIAARSEGNRHREITEWDRERTLGAADQLWWWGRRWQRPERRSG